MPSFVKGPSYSEPFGNRSFLRSTEGVKTESRTFAAATLTAETIDGFSQKILYKGTALAKITSGSAADIGKIGPYQPATNGADEVQTLTRTSTGGTITLAFDGETTAAIAATAAGFTAAAVQSALDATSAFNPGDVVVTGAAGGPLSVTFSGARFAKTNVAQLVVDNTLATGGTIVAATATAGTAGSNGASDGRGDAANIVGLNNTFLPWQLLDRDVEVAVVYECAAVQSKCCQVDAAGARAALSDATASAMQNAKGVRILFK